MSFSKARRSGGFTLIELLATLAVMAVVSTLAIPAYREWQLRNALLEASNSFIAAAQAARSHALASGYPTLVEALDGEWEKGWRVVGDNNGNGQWDSDADTLLLECKPLRQGITLATPDNAIGIANTLVDGYLLFNGQGFARSRTGSMAGGRLEFRYHDRMRAVVFYRTGRIRSCDNDACK